MSYERDKVKKSIISKAIRDTRKIFFIYIRIELKQRLVEAQRKNIFATEDEVYQEFHNSRNVWRAAPGPHKEFYTLSCDNVEDLVDDIQEYSLKNTEQAIVPFKFKRETITYLDYVVDTVVLEYPQSADSCVDSTEEIPTNCYTIKYITKRNQKRGMSSPVVVGMYTGSLESWQQGCPYSNYLKSPRTIEQGAKLWLNILSRQCNDFLEKNQDEVLDPLYKIARRIYAGKSGYTIVQVECFRVPFTKECIRDAWVLCKGREYIDAGTDIEVLMCSNNKTVTETKWWLQPTI